MRGTLDVVIPADNAGRFLGATLPSVACQHVLPNMVTVIDGAGAGDTAARYAGFLPIRAPRNPGSRGPALSARPVGGADA